MKTIEVDTEVYAALRNRSATDNVTENDVLRELLQLPRDGSKDASTDAGFLPGDWLVKGVRFPTGTEFRADYQGQTYVARVENGALVLNGERFNTPSAAAVSITKMTINGWIFWKCRFPGHASWRAIKTLRK